MSNTVTVTIVSGVEGQSIYLNDERVTGPKPWGGGRILGEAVTDIDSLIQELERLRDSK